LLQFAKRSRHFGFSENNFFAELHGRSTMIDSNNNKGHGLSRVYLIKLGALILTISFQKRREYIPIGSGKNILVFGGFVQR
jgi:hypothetical protein